MCSNNKKHEIRNTTKNCEHENEKENEVANTSYPWLPQGQLQIHLFLELLFSSSSPITIQTKLKNVDSITTTVYASEQIS